MLTVCAMSDGAGYAKRYLEQDDYYAEGERVVGRWQGKGAELLDLAGEVAHEDFEALRVGHDPKTGEKLRQRESADRYSADGSKQSAGRSLYDLTFSAPKSVSVMSGPGGDERLVAAHDKVVQEALAEAETHAATRVRIAGANEDRVTGNMVVAVYRHDTSRELDPQLHTHCAAANVTYDSEEDRWKALQAGGIYQRRAYLSEVYRNALAREVMRLGYEIETRRDSNGKDLGFEIVGVSPTLLEKFSQRSAQRDAAIKEFTEAKGRPPTNREIAALVKETRADKQPEISAAEVKKKQMERMSSEEIESLASLKAKAVGCDRCASERAEPSLQYATDHVFDRVSVARDFDVLAEALRHGRGRVDLGELKGVLQMREAAETVIRSGHNIATRESLERERKMVERVNRGMGAYEKLGGPDNHFQASYDCTPEQREAVAFILNSRDLAVNLRGPAGTGKTHTLKQIKYGLHTVGIEMIAVAPTRDAVEVLQREGFADAMTCKRLADDEKVQAKLKGKVLVVDEAGMISGRQMAEILELAEKHGARLLFSGDTRQLRSVEACDSLRILEEDSQLKTVALQSVQRQTGAYREAVEALRSAPLQGFFQLEKMGAIREVPYLERPEAVVAAYFEAIAQPNAKGKMRDVLIVCPTHEEIGRVTEAIREDLRSRNQLGLSCVLERLEPLNWTAAQKGEARNYEAGQVLVFHEATTGARKNEQFRVVRAERDRMVARNERGEERVFTSAQANCFGVFHQEAIEVAANDKLVLRENRGGWRGFKATNGEIVSVKYLDDQDRIHLKDGRILPKDYRQFDHGYAVTAHRAQGKTVDAVIISGDVMDRELFYVAASRGRESVTVLTSCIDVLRESICWSGDRMSASELARRSSTEKTIDRWAAAHDRSERKGVGEVLLEGLCALGVEALQTVAATVARAILSWTPPSFGVGRAHVRNVAEALQNRSAGLEREGR